MYISDSIALPSCVNYVSIQEAPRVGFSLRPRSLVFQKWVYSALTGLQCESHLLSLFLLSVLHEEGCCVSSCPNKKCVNLYMGLSFQSYSSFFPLPLNKKACTYARLLANKNDEIIFITLLLIKYKEVRLYFNYKPFNFVKKKFVWNYLYQR